MPGSPVTIVVATHNRVQRLFTTLEHLDSLAEAAQIIVADNASTDGTAQCVARQFPQVRLLALRHNFGAYARTIALRETRTPYVAFCDDDTWWMRGSLTEGCAVLDRYPQIALLNARVIVEPFGRVDNACRRMAQAPPVDGLPGHPILFFQAGAALARVGAIAECGGFDRVLFFGGEEALVSIDLVRRGWHMQYLPSLEVRHAPCPTGRDNGARKRWTVRNRLLVAWMRYHPASAWRLTTDALHRAASDGQVRAGLMRALARAPWAITHRHAIDASLQRRIDALQAPQFS